MYIQALAWLRRCDHLAFYWINRRLRHPALDLLLGAITHLGGAAATISATLAAALLAPPPWSAMGWQSAVSLTISFLITTGIKFRLRRIRPYQRLADVRVIRNPLRDYSFPSGHSTSIFSIVTPFLSVSPALSAGLLALALTVALSRVYWGLHYPSDCLAGCAVGWLTGLLTVAGAHLLAG